MSGEVVHRECWPGGIGWVPPRPERYDYGRLTVGLWGGYLVQVEPHLRGHLLVLTPDDPDSDGGYDHGWLYRNAHLVLVAVGRWSPQREAEPPGYDERVTPGVRVAGQRWELLAQRHRRLAGG